MMELASYLNNRTKAIWVLLVVMLGCTIGAVSAVGGFVGQGIIAAAAMPMMLFLVATNRPVVTIFLLFVSLSFPLSVDLGPVAVMLSEVLILIGIVTQIILGRRPARDAQAVAIFMGALVFISLVGLLRSTDLYQGVNWLRFAALDPWLLFIMISSYTLDKTSVSRTLVLISAVACGISAWTLAIHFAAGGGFVNAIKGPFDHHSLFGGYLVMTVPLTIFLATNGSEVVKLLARGSAVLSTAAILFTYSRGAWVGLFGALAVQMVFGRKKLYLVVMTAALLIVLSLNQGLMSHVASIVNPKSYLTIDRYILGAKLPKILRESWLLGIGPGSFQQMYASLSGVGERVFVHSHNTSLNWLIQTGVLGLVTWLAVLGLAYRSVLRRCRVPQIRPMAQAILSGTLGLLIMTLFDDPFFLTTVGEVFWMLIALLLTLRVPDSVKEETL